MAAVPSIQAMTSRTRSTRLGASDKAADVRLDDGTRIEVKAAVAYDGRRLDLSPFRTIEHPDGQKPFDIAVVVVFEPEIYRVREAWEIPLDLVKKRSPFSSHVNGYRLTLTDDVCRDPGVVNVSAKLQRQQSPDLVTRAP